jgi:type IV pilus assembly protein PilC
MAATREFAYEAVNAAGTTVKGTVEAESEDAASRLLSGQRMTPLHVSPAGQGLKKEIALPGLRTRTTPKDLAVFSRQFASMTASGLTLMRALAILEKETAKEPLRVAVSRVRAAVQSGAPLSTSLAAHPDQFPGLMISMVRAGETGGFLDDALARIARMYEADAHLKAKIKSALTYPTVVLIFSLLMAAGVITFIVPVFARMFRNFGSKLPLPTRIMVALSHSIWWLGPIALGALVLGARAVRRRYRRDAAFRLRADTLKLRLPVVGGLVAKVAISRWARNLSTLLHVGVPVIQALDVVADTAGNAVIGEAMQDVKSAVRTGKQMSGPLSKHPVFPGMAVQMLEVGEETGQISEMLDRLADFYDSEVQTATEALSSALEPLMVVVLGAMIGVMVVCLYLPMFSIYSHIGGGS